MQILPVNLLVLAWLIIQIVDANKKLSKEEKVKRAKERMEKINNNPRNKGKWKAGFNERFVLMDEDQQRQLNGGRLPKEIEQLTPTTVNNTKEENNGSKGEYSNSTTMASRRKRQVTCTMSYAFDVRKQWPGCAAFINMVQDQSSCGSCWAVATASAFTDRYCIQRAKKGLATDANDPSRHASAADLMTCSDAKASPPDGCQGGYHEYAWRWTKNYGIVTGTNYTWYDGCKPYPFPPEGTIEYTTPSCTSSCTKSGWFLTPKKQATWSKVLYYPSLSAIQNEIRVNGSVTAYMMVYQDFLDNYFGPNYIYEHYEGEQRGGHFVRLIGWGTKSCSNGYVFPFWLGVNSWGTGWGDNGFFRIYRGTNECDIERSIAFGTPNPDL